MSADTLLIEGELYLTLETVAQVYEVQVTWLRDAYEVGLFGSAATARPCIAVTQLDRVSTVVRLHVALGLDLDAIELMLAP